jgi:putative membrane protein
MNWKNWKLILLRTLVNGLAIGLTALVLPGISIPDPTFGKIVLIGAIFGLLNAFIKPVIQVLTISLLFVTYGLVLFVVNTVMLLLLAWLLPEQTLIVSSIWAALLGGFLIGLIGSVLENLLGLTPPIGIKAAPVVTPERILTIRQPHYDPVVAEMSALKEEVEDHETHEH